MTVREIYSLLQYSHYFKSLSQSEILTIFENASHSIIAYRDEEVDLISGPQTKLITNRQLTDRLGIQNLDAKIAEEFPKLSLSSRLLLYRIIQNRIYKWYPDLYDFDTNISNIYVGLVYESSIVGTISVIPRVDKSLTYTTPINARVWIPISERKSVVFISNLVARVATLLKSTQSLIYQSIIVPSVRVVTSVSKDIYFSAIIIPSVRLISSSQKNFTYSSTLNASVRSFTGSDYVRDFSYISALQAQVYIE